MRVSILLLLAGLSLVTYGLYLAWPPLSCVVLGAALVAYALMRENGAKKR